MSFRAPSILPGFGITLGFSTFFLSAIVLIPVAALIAKTGMIPKTAAASAAAVFFLRVPTASRDSPSPASLLVV